MTTRAKKISSIKSLGISLWILFIVLRAFNVSYNPVIEILLSAVINIIVLFFAFKIDRKVRFAF
jgi:hypothetical protein